jgi:hypothetical protein
MSEYSAADLIDIFSSLNEAHWSAIIVGGQAVNLWCSRYADAIASLSDYFPIVSRDLDFHGGLQEARSLMKLLGGKGKLNLGSDPSPNAGVVDVPMTHGGRLIIDVLTTVYGVSSSELVRTSVEWEFNLDNKSANVRVIHPLLLLESKLACFRSLPQQGRQDEKHAKLMILVVKAWLTEQLPEARSVFRAIERLASLIITPDGLNAYANGMELWDSMPLEAMQADHAYRSFFDKRLAQLQSDSSSTRQRYIAAVNSATFGDEG